MTRRPDAGAPRSPHANVAAGAMNAVDCSGAAGESVLTPPGYVTRNGKAAPSIERGRAGWAEVPVVVSTFPSDWYQLVRLRVF